MKCMKVERVHKKTVCIPTVHKTGLPTSDSSLTTGKADFKRLTSR